MKKRHIIAIPGSKLWSSTLLQHATSGCPVSIDLFDEVGIAGGASGVAGGLLHAFTNKGEKRTFLQRSAII